MRPTQKNIQVVGAVVDTCQPGSSLPGSRRGAAFQKKVLTMTKAHSPHLITFSPDAEDNHFMIIEVKKRATGATVCSHYVLRADVPTWTDYYETDGFEITNNSENGE